MNIPELITKAALRRGLSHKTIVTYNQCVKQFFKRCRKYPKQVKKKDVEDHLDYLIQKGAGGNTLNVNLNALKFFYNKVLRKRLMINIEFSKTPKTYPIHLTKQEVDLLIQAIKNPKHRLMIKLIYSAGLRVGELVKLKPSNIEFGQNYGWIRKGKGRKDRRFVLAKKIKGELMNYIENENISHDSWIFKGQKGHITVSTIQQIVKNAAKNAKIEKNVHPHTLRHSFATHLVENGYDLISVQSLLGHSRSDTTMMYVHMASPNLINVQSPLDAF